MMQPGHPHFPPPPHFPPQQPPKKNSRTWLIVLGVLFAFGVLIFGSCGALMVLGAVLPDAPAKAPRPTPVVENYLGEWAGPEGVSLSVSRGKGLEGEPRTYVRYSKVTPNSNVELTGRLKELDGPNLVIGVMFLNKTVEVDDPPHLEGGVWKMTVRGDVLTRTKIGT